MNPGELFRRVRHFVLRDRMSRELEEEMRLHLELRADRIGVNAAQQKFGNTTSVQQRSRDGWGFGRLEDLRQDIQFAMRRIWTQRSVSLTVIVVMGIGIGATTAMFSAIDAVILRPLPFPKPEQLVVMPIRVPAEGAPYPEGKIGFEEVRVMRDLFSGVAAYGVGGLNLSDDDRPVRLKVGVVTTEFFATMGVIPAIGRAFLPQEGANGGANVAILSEGLWKRQFGGRPLAELTVKLNKATYNVIGVMPQSFTFPEQSDIWIPMAVPNTTATIEAFGDYVRQSTVARLAENVSVEYAAAQMMARLENANVKGSPRDVQREAEFLKIRKLQQDVVLPAQAVFASQRSRALIMLLGATGLLLLIACANVINLLLAQANVRRREITLRQVLGATRTRIIRQLLTESVLLSLCGALVGLAVAVGSFQTLRALMPPTLLGISDVRIDVRMLSFATVIAVVAGVAFGLWPALGSSRNDAAQAIKGGDGHGVTARSFGNLRRTLVGAEIALTVVLLIGAGILLRSFANVLNRDAGIQTTNVGSLELAFPSASQPAERLRILNAIQERMRSMPGVVAAGATRGLPLASAGGSGGGINVPGSPFPDKEFRGSIPNIFESASGGYFRSLNISLLEGRVFNANEDLIESRSVIVSASLAKRHWPNASPIGREVYLSSSKEPYIVVGVVADVLRRLESKPIDQMYLPMTWYTPAVTTLVARGAEPSSAILQLMIEAVHAVDPTQAVFNPRMMDDIRDSSVAPRRTSATLLAVFAGLALTLASIGVYAVVSYGMTQRERELGIRSALGASGANLLGLLSREMTWVATLGISIGLFGAWSGARVLETQVFGIDVHDRATFVVVPLTLLVVTMLATIIPARRVYRVNPSEIMRAD